MFKMNDHTVLIIMILVIGAMTITGSLVEGCNKKPHLNKSIPVASIKAKGIVLGKHSSTLTIQTANDVVDEPVRNRNIYNVIEEGDTIE